MRKIKRYVPDILETTISQVLDILFQLSMELWDFLIELWQRFLFILSIKLSDNPYLVHILSKESANSGTSKY